MLHTPSRASTASSSSFQPVSRQNTMSSYDGSRSARQSKRYSMSALYMSMSANETDLEIEDELAKGTFSALVAVRCSPFANYPFSYNSAEEAPRLQGQNLVAIQTELRPGKGCAVSRLENCPAHPKPYGAGGGTWNMQTRICTQSRYFRTFRSLVLTLCFPAKRGCQPSRRYPGAAGRRLSKRRQDPEIRQPHVPTTIRA